MNNVDERVNRVNMVNSLNSGVLIESSEINLELIKKFLQPVKQFGYESFPTFDSILGAQCLWHSNWTICSLLRQLSSEIFPNFDFHTWGSVSMAFKLDHLQPGKSIWF